VLKSKFVWNELGDDDLDQVNPSLHPQIEKLILHRNLATKETIREIDDEKLTLHDPFLFKDMGVCVDRIKIAIEAEEPILVYGDYDADGVTSIAILVSALRELGAVVDFYIPNRFYEGYGPNEEAFMQAVDDGFKLIITVDCGITGIAEAKLLKEHGVDFIITDHHEPKDEIPEAIAIIHPELDDAYPFSYLAGAGVALKVAQALLGEARPMHLMFATFGTIGDVVTLKDENRNIAKVGLSILRETDHAGIKILMNMADVNFTSADEQTVGFSICPRLNAPGRMDDARIAADLLLCDNQDEAREIAKKIESLNEKRRTETGKITEEALKISQERNLDDKKIVIFYKENWHEGVLGIVASKLVTKLQKAVIMLTRSEEGFAKGSARAPEGFHLAELLTDNEKLLYKFGGHAQAAGLSMDISNIEILESKMNDMLKETTVSLDLDIDLSVPFKDISFDFLDEISILSPFGSGNPVPIIKLSDVKIKNVKRIGTKSQHLKFAIYQGDTFLDAVFFDGSEWFAYMTEETIFDFIIELQINRWNGKVALQARIIDVKCDDLQVINLRNPKLRNEFLAHFEQASDFIIDSLPPSQDILLENFKNSGASNVVLTPIDVPTRVSREKFKQVYQVIKNQAPFRVNGEVVRFFFQEGILRNELLFILQVFSELNFVIIKDNVVNSAVVQKVELESSSTYREQQMKIEVYELLELSTTSELKKFLVSLK